jgi:hypothetical protein
MGLLPVAARRSGTHASGLSGRHRARGEWSDQRTVVLLVATPSFSQRVLGQRAAKALPAMLPGHQVARVRNVRRSDPEVRRDEVGADNPRRPGARPGRIPPPLPLCRPCGGDASSPLQEFSEAKQKPRTKAGRTSREPRLRDWEILGGARPRFRGRSLSGESDRAPRAERRDCLVANAVTFRGVAKRRRDRSTLRSATRACGRVPASAAARKHALQRGSSRERRLREGASGR